MTTPSVVNAPARCRPSTSSRNPWLVRRNAGARTPPNRNQDEEDDSDNEEQDEDCAQEDECEIDWDTMMPPTDNNDDDEMAVATMKEQLERQFAGTASTSRSTTSSMDDDAIRGQSPDGHVPYTAAASRNAMASHGSGVAE